MMLAFSMVAAMLHVRTGGVGQIIDCAMTDGSALLTSMMWGMMAQGRWSDTRDSNILDGAAPFYATYETADGKAVALGPIEPAFYSSLLAKLGVDENSLAEQMDRSSWPHLKRRLQAIFKTRSRDEWIAVFEGSDSCFAPILSMAEAPRHPHNVASSTFIEVAGVTQPAPAPRYSKTVNEAPCERRGGIRALLDEAGVSRERVDALRDEGVLSI